VLCRWFHSHAYLPYGRAVLLEVRSDLAKLDRHFRLSLTRVPSPFRKIGGASLHRQYGSTKRCHRSQQSLLTDDTVTTYNYGVKWNERTPQSATKARDLSEPTDCGHPSLPKYLHAYHIPPDSSVYYVDGLSPM
jgi:hypothetical protein